jgi:hypothetical protein
MQLRRSKNPSPARTGENLKMAPEPDPGERLLMAFRARQMSKSQRRRAYPLRSRLTARGKGIRMPSLCSTASGLASIPCDRASQLCPGRTMAEYHGSGTLGHWEESSSDSFPSSSSIRAEASILVRCFGAFTPSLFR